MKNGKVAFVGGGNMTRAIAGGLIDSGFAPDDIYISEPVDDTRQFLAKKLPGVMYGSVIRSEDLIRFDFLPLELSTMKQPR